MVTRLKRGIKKPPHEKLNLQVDFTSPILLIYLQAFKDPNWLKSMKEEYCALIKNKMWVLVPRPQGANITNFI